MNKWNMLKPKLLRTLLPSPLKADHVEVSMIASLHDDPAVPTDWLIQTCLRAIEEARKVDLSDVSKRMQEPPYYPNIWPGEHYKLLAGFVKSLQPKVVIEIGTFRGIGTLSLAKYLPENGKLAAFDPVPWHQVSTTVLKQSDFGDRLVQYNDDLADMQAVEKHQSLLRNADLFLIDAAKDNVMERGFIKNLKAIGLKPNTIVIFDDTRLWNMLEIWRSIDFPKIDLTSFGHWAGTGVVQWNPA